MPIQVWSGTPSFEYTHEGEALGVFLREMHNTYGADRETYHVLYNFLAGNQPIDLAVLKHKGLFVIELKHVGGPVTGGENGPWSIRDGNREVPLRGGKHLNPFLQVAHYRQNLIALMKEHHARFLSTRTSLPRLDQVQATVALSPVMPDGSRLDLPRTPWFRIIGLNELHLDVFRRTTPAFALTDEEQQRLIESVLRLTEQDIYRFIPRPSSKKALATTSYPTPTPSDTTQKPSTKRMVPTGLGDDFVAVLSGESAPINCIRGTLEGIEQLKESGFLLHIRSDEQSAPVVKVRVQGPSVHCISHLRNRIGARRTIRLACHHLWDRQSFFDTNTNSVVILEPDWLINVTDFVNVDYCERQLALNLFSPRPGSSATLRGSLFHRITPLLWLGTNQSDQERFRNDFLEEAFYEMILTNSHPESVDLDAQPHIQRIEAWFDKKRNIFGKMRSETFIIEPRLGMQGKLDAVWEKDRKIIALGEFKTSRCWGARVQFGHEIQALAYALMLAVKTGMRPPNLPRTSVLYTKNDILDPGDLAVNVEREVALVWQNLRKAIDKRNELVKVNLTGEALFAANENKCRKCQQSDNCGKIALLGRHEDTRSMPTKHWMQGAASFDPDEQDQRIFKHYERLLVQELEAVKASQARIWRTHAQDRIDDGKALRVAACKPISEAKNVFRVQA